MDSEIIAALIGGGATLLAALLAIFGTTISSALKRKSLGYPSIKGCWKATWYIDGIDEIYLEDIVMIKKIRGMKIYGEGINTGKGNYPLTGKFSKNLILNFIYESNKDYVSLSGVIILKMNPLGEQCSGKWYGYIKEDKITGGTVIWDRR